MDSGNTKHPNPEQRPYHHKKWHGDKTISEADKEPLEAHGVKTEDLSIFKVVKDLLEQDKIVEDLKHDMAEGLKNDLTLIHDTVVHKFHEMVASKLINGYDAQLAANSMLHDIANAFEHDHPELMNEKAAFTVDGGHIEKVETFAEYLHDDFLILE